MSTRTVPEVIEVTCDVCHQTICGKQNHGKLHYTGALGTSGAVYDLDVCLACIPVIEAALKEAMAKVRAKAQDRVRTS